MKKKLLLKTHDTKQPESLFVSEIEEESIRFLDLTEKTKQEMGIFYSQMLEDPDSQEISDYANSLKRTASNTTKALARIYSTSDEFNSRLKDIRLQRKKRRLHIPVPANATIDWAESKLDHFAKGLNLYKLLLVCFIGSFVGVVVEVLWTLVNDGYIESRSGLVYGPFNLLYGIGAVLMTACLYRFRNHGAWISFLGGMAVGSVVEYFCSWGQEFLFGSRSWDYSHMPFHINGRICLLYSIFWGLLAVLWIKRLYPIVVKGILKVPNLAGRIITWSLAIFFAFNLFMTTSSMYRWTQRMDGIAGATDFDAWMDVHFPDERMETIFANMEFVN